MRGRKGSGVASQVIIHDDNAVEVQCKNRIELFTSWMCGPEEERLYNLLLLLQLSLTIIPIGLKRERERICACALLDSHMVDAW